MTTAKKLASTVTEKPIASTTKKTTTKKPAAKKKPVVKSDESEQPLIGWRAKAGEFSYAEFDVILEKAVPLVEYRPDWYVRGTNGIPEDKIEEYETMLCFPGTDGKNIYMIQHPLLFWEVDGKWIIIKGNNRFWTAKRLHEQGVILERVPYERIIGDLTKREAERLQYNDNDTTQKHDALIKQKRIVEALQEEYTTILASGDYPDFPTLVNDDRSKSNFARTQAIENINIQLGLNRNDVAMAVTIVEALSPRIEQLYAEGQISASAIFRLANRATVLNVSTDAILDDLISKNQTLASPNFMKWEPAEPIVKLPTTQTEQLEELAETTGTEGTFDSSKVGASRTAKTSNTSTGSTFDALDIELKETSEETQEAPKMTVEQFRANAETTLPINYLLRFVNIMSDNDEHKPAIKQKLIELIGMVDQEELDSIMSLMM